MDDASVLKKYTQHLERIPCNLCGADDGEIIARKERFGLDLDTVICRRCGLIYLNPRPTKGAYARMNTADYRIAVSGTGSGNEQLFRAEYAYFAKKIIPFCLRNILFVPDTILDIGCSCGGALKVLGELYPKANLFGVEPLRGFAEYARNVTGASVTVGLFEDCSTDQKFDVILFSKALNHTLDPKRNLEKIRSLLSPRGVLILIVHDPLSTLVAYPIEHAAEILQPYMFYREVLRYLLDQAGFAIIEYYDRRFAGPSRKQMRSVAFSKMIVFARRAEIGCAETPVPDYRAALALIDANNEARNRYGDIFHRWQHPTFAMKVYRKMSQIFSF